MCLSCQIKSKDTSSPLYPDMKSVSLENGSIVEFSTYPITVAQFGRFIEHSNFKTESDVNNEEGCWGVREDRSVGWMPNENWRDNSLDQASDHPVVCVSWNDAVAYTEWLTLMSGETYRLPYIDEWEHAAHGVSDSTYYYGNDVSEACKYINHADVNFLEVFNEHAIVSPCDDGYKVTSPVGSYDSNKFGLYDMYGNVWEWQLSCVKDESSPDGGKCNNYALRGGSYASQPKGIAIGYVNSGSRSTRTADYGFRVIKVNARLTQ